MGDPIQSKPLNNSQVTPLKVQRTYSCDITDLIASVEEEILKNKYKVDIKKKNGYILRDEKGYYIL